MRDQLIALDELARTDLTFRQIDVELSDIQTRLAELRTDVDRIRELLDRERDQMTEAEKLRTSHLAELEAIAEKTARSKKRHDTAKNNRELEAAQKELEVLKREREERSAEADKLATTITAVREQIGRHEGDYKSLVELRDQEEREAGVKVEALKVRRGEIEGSRREMVAKVRADLMRNYAMVFNRRGSGVAQTTDGVCRGCHMSLPPQLFNQVLAMAKVFQCPNCQRFLMPPAAMLR